MRIVFFSHSLVSDWNHGNAHFLRGVVRELMGRGHSVTVWEPQSGWSLSNLRQDAGAAALARFATAYPSLKSQFYDSTLDVGKTLDGADLVIAHEWNERWLLQALARHHRSHSGYRLLFHDTHHRSVTAPDTMPVAELESFDGVLAFGEAIRQAYLDRHWARRVWTWHEAADVMVFRPLEREITGDLVWIGNWGDEERTAELDEFLLGPVRDLRLGATVHGVRFPEEARQRLAALGIAYGGYLPNPQVPEVFARHRLTVHIPRRPYATALPGIPTIRVFEALACGIPLVSAPWDDCEHLFAPGLDFLVARTGAAMKHHIAALLADREYGAALARHGRETILARHTCRHRVDALLGICAELGVRELETAP